MGCLAKVEALQELMSLAHSMVDSERFVKSCECGC